MSPGACGSQCLGWAGLGWAGLGWAGLETQAPTLRLRARQPLTDCCSLYCSERTAGPKGPRREQTPGCEPSRGPRGKGALEGIGASAWSHRQVQTGLPPVVDFCRKLSPVRGTRVRDEHTGAPVLGGWWGAGKGRGVRTGQVGCTKCYRHWQPRDSVSSGRFDGGVGDGAAGLSEGSLIPSQVQRLRLSSQLFFLLINIWLAYNIIFFSGGQHSDLTFI